MEPENPHRSYEPVCCSICLDPCATSGPLPSIITSCGHQFHTACIVQYAEHRKRHLVIMNESVPCPVCRRIIFHDDSAQNDTIAVNVIDENNGDVYEYPRTGNCCFVTLCSPNCGIFMILVSCVAVILFVLISIM